MKHSMGIPGNDYLIKQKGLSKNATTEDLLGLRYKQQSKNKEKMKTPRGEKTEPETTTINESNSGVLTWGSRRSLTIQGRIHRAGTQKPSEEQRENTPRKYTGGNKAQVI